jgi:hypothetical protein
MSMAQLLEEQPSTTFRYYKNVKEVKFDLDSVKAKQQKRRVHVTVIQGKAGTGKTSWAFSNALDGK